MDRAKEALRRRTSRYSSKDTWIYRGGARRHQQRGGKLRHEPREQQIKLLGRFTRRVIVNYDRTAGQTATERSLSLLLEHDLKSACWRCQRW